MLTAAAAAPAGYEHSQAQKYPTWSYTHGDEKRNGHREKTEEKKGKGRGSGKMRGGGVEEENQQADNPTAKQELDPNVT